MLNNKGYVEVNCSNNAFSSGVLRKPLHLRVRVSEGPNYRAVKGMLRGLRLHTVCEEAGCPNIYECFEAKTATFLILGDTCTRNCRFCRVSGGTPLPPDPDEPAHVAQAVRQLGLRYAVVTSVTRDDLPDGGAASFSETIRSIRNTMSACAIEVLIPDFGGDVQALAMVVRAEPDVINHNVETVPRLYPLVRPAADYERSLRLLKQAKELGFAGRTKSGVMVGLGEEHDELYEAMADLRHHGCDILTIGQYLAPSRDHFPIARFYDPEEFKELERVGHKMGFTHVESGPLVRSSYHAQEQFGESSKDQVRVKGSPPP